MGRGAARAGGVSSPHLTDAEVAEITEPLEQAAARRRFFERCGLKVGRKPNGQPLVSRADWAAHLAAHHAAGVSAANAPSIDWSKVREIGRAKRA